MHGCGSANEKRLACTSFIRSFTQSMPMFSFDYSCPFEVSVAHRDLDIASVEQGLTTWIPPEIFSSVTIRKESIGLACGAPVSLRQTLTQWVERLLLRRRQRILLRQHDCTTRRWRSGAGTSGTRAALHRV